jgi:hypothetical protein
MITLRVIPEMESVSGWLETLSAWDWAFEIARAVVPGPHSECVVVEDGAAEAVAS